MAGIVQTLTTSFKVQILSAGHNFASSSTVPTPTSRYTQDIFYIALYTIANGASLDSTTTAYTTAGEVSNTGYTAGGQQLVISTLPTSGGTPSTTAYLNFADVTWFNATFSADGALIYNVSNSNYAVGALNFGGTKNVTNGTFKIQFPAAGTGSSIIQIA
jgi:hypothetical protein